MRSFFLTLTIVLASLLPLRSANAHCEIPCGVYGDQMRIDMILEDVTTIEKSMKAITELGKEGDKNYNQLVRWITNKEEHANKVQAIVYDYFMNQRIKPPETTEGEVYTKYVHELSLLHLIAVTAMKAKQTTDLAHLKTIRDAVDAFSKSYFPDQVHNHAQ